MNGILCSPYGYLRITTGARISKIPNGTLVIEGKIAGVEVPEHWIAPILTGAELIAAERKRQIYVEGYTSEHDDAHRDGSIARAAACYASTAAAQVTTAQLLPDCFVHKDWPWQRNDFSASKDPIRNLVKAGALIAAEIDRLQRLAATTKGAA